MLITTGMVAVQWHAPVALAIGGWCAGVQFHCQELGGMGRP